jgi:hypothetical protein
VRPAIDGDSGDIARRAESARTQHAVKLIGTLPLELLERSIEEPIALRGFRYCPRRRERRFEVGSEDSVD